MAKTVVLWTIAILLALLFLSSALPKLQAGDAMKQRFADWGYSASFLLLIGVLEGLGGILVLIPRLATYGAGILVVVMAGAVYTHLSSGIGSPWFALVALLLAAVLGWLRKDDALLLGG